MKLFSDPEYRNKDPEMMALRVRTVVTLGILFVGLIGTGVPATYLIFKSSGSSASPTGTEQLPEPQSRKITVFYPVRRIPAGSGLEAASFRQGVIEADEIRTHHSKLVNSVQELGGKFAADVLVPELPLTKDMLHDTAYNLLARRIPEGHRAATIRVDDVSGIEGWSMPGAQVDVLWTGDDGKGVPSVTAIVENAQVLSVMGNSEVDQPSAGSASEGKAEIDAVGQVFAGARRKAAPPTSFTVTLMVSPRDGKKLFLAGTRGRLSMLLRGDLDSGKATDPRQSADVFLEDLSSNKPMPRSASEGSLRVKRDDGKYDEFAIVQGQVARSERASFGE